MEPYQIVDQILQKKNGWVAIRLYFGWTGYPMPDKLGTVNIQCFKPNKLSKKIEHQLEEQGYYCPERNCIDDSLPCNKFLGEIDTYNRVTKSHLPAPEANNVSYKPGINASLYGNF